MSNPAVLIAIVNWNNKKFILRILESLQGISYDSYTILVVDNNSTDGSVEAVREQFNNVDLLLNKENIGSTGGFNAALKHAAESSGYDYVWLLDNDAEVEIDTLSKMVSFMEANKDVGMCGCEIYDNYVRDFMVESGSFVTKSGRLQAVFDKYKVPPKNPEVDFVVACSCLVRVDALKTVGFMDERYFLFWDDIDYSFKMKKHGYKVAVASEAKAYHKPFLYGERLFNSYYEIRNRLLFTSKYFNFIRRFISYIWLSRFVSKYYFYALFQNNSFNQNRITCAIKDFMSNKWGMRNFTNNNNHITDNKFENIQKLLFKDNVKILVLTSGDRFKINNILDNILKLDIYIKKTVVLDIIIDKKRVDLVDKEKLIAIDSVIYEENILTRYLFFINLIVNFIKIRINSYDIIIDTASHEIHPYYYAVKKTYVFNDGEYTEISENSTKLNKIILAYIIGEITSLILFPVIYLTSFRYNDSN